MKVTEFTRKALARRRQKRDLTALGYEQISCAHGIGDLWELDRGFRTGWRITDAILGVDGKSIFAKAEPMRAEICATPRDSKSQPQYPVVP